MTNRIPPSLNWLINKRARIAGEIIQTKKGLRKVQDLVIKLNKLEDELKSIDGSLKLHDIQINIENIRSIRTHCKHLRFPQGCINDYILQFLISKSDDFPTSKLEIVDHIILKHYELGGDQIAYKTASRIVKQSLGRSCKLGRVVRHHNRKTRDHGFWTISKEFRDKHKSR